MPFFEDFQNRRDLIHSRKFILLVIVLFLTVASAATGFYLYRKYPEEHIKNAASSGLLPRQWLIEHFATDDENRVGGPDGDPDGDILTNLQEFYFGTNPAHPDSDGDGQMDGAEVAINSNPLGEGSFYSTEYAKQVADRYLDSNSLEEFKRENIEKQVLGILNPPKLEDVQIDYADLKTLNISRDNDETTADKYLEEMEKRSQRLDLDQSLIAQALDNPSGFDGKITPGLIYDTVNEVRKIKVPSDFVKFHQLHIAGLFAAAKIFEVAQAIDPSAEIESQASKYQAQYYQVSVIQKVDSELKQEAVNLKQKYNEVIQKYESQF